MPTWDPTLYLAFADHRLRPAFDLLARIPLEAPRTIYDLGCGPGNVTALLAARWPGARVIGVDSSTAMLSRARATAAAVEWREADIRAWTPTEAPDLVFSNATLHWLDDHERLLPRLAGFLAPGGVLAIQMPHNHASPSHTAIRATAEAGPWRERLRDVCGISPVHDPAAYHRILARRCTSLDIWRTEYLHVLEGDDPVAAWTKGTALRPYLDALTEPERSAFFADYAARVAATHPKEPDGRTLFPFLRLFVVAQV
jgi:trans-aconitate 2-methyltransferase